MYMARILCFSNVAMNIMSVFDTGHTEIEVKQLNLCIGIYFTNLRSSMASYSSMYGM